MNQSVIAQEKAFQTDVTQVIRRLWPTIRPFLGRFAFGVSLILCTTAIELMLPLVIGKVVDVVAAGHDGSGLTRLCFVFLGLIVLKSVFDSIQAYVIQATGQGITHELRCLLFERIERLSISYYDRNPTGRLLTRVINDIKSLSELFTASISVLVLDAMVILGTIVAMFALNAKLAAVTLVTFPLVFWTIRHFGHQLAVAYRKVRARLGEINAFLGENIGAIATIQRLSAEKERLTRFSSIVEKHQAAQMESLNVFAYVQPIANLLNGISTATLIILGGYWAIKGEITIGVVVAFLGFLRNLFQPIRDLVEKYNTFLSAMVSAERVVSILDETPEERGEISHSILAAEATVEFSDVSFQYPTRQGLQLQNVTFTVPAGKSLAIVGATGSGKSTLIRLLLRFYDATSGEIRFAGHSLSQWDRFQLRKLIGVVHQEIYLFQGTVRENLVLGRSGLSDEYLRKQCERAQLWEFIQSRGGLDLEVFEGGNNFSLGERQLLSFARILVQDTPVLVLDEATSSVDRILEKRLMRAVQEVIAERTSIVIAHRLSTIRECDAVLVLNAGSVAEVGTYSGLLSQGGLFKKLHDIHESV